MIAGNAWSIQVGGFFTATAPMTPAMITQHRKNTRIGKVIGPANRPQISPAARNPLDTPTFCEQEIALKPSVVVYVPRGVKHKAVGKLTILTICNPPGVLHDIHEVE
jgi:hypothetical protein